MSRYTLLALLALWTTATIAAEPVAAPGAPPPSVSQPAAVSEQAAADSDADASEGTDEAGLHQIFSLGHDAVLAKGGRAAEVVAVFGTASSEGDVRGEIVSVFGETRISGHAAGEAVAVFGDNYINGRVDGQAVAVFGNLELGPQADVGGDIVVVGGELHRSPGAIIHGDVQHVGGFLAGGVHGFGRWVHEGALYGRMLSFSGDVRWAWILALGFLVLYALLALLLREPFERCLQTLETRPGHAFLAGLFTLLLTPILFFLLLITLVGILAIPPIGAALICVCLFGKTVVLGWLGRRCLGTLDASQAPAQPVVAVLIGGVIVLALYTVPIIGMIVFNLLGVLALGTVVYTLILATQHNMTPTAAAAPGAAEPVSAAPAPASQAPGTAGAAAGPEPAQPETKTSEAATPAAAPPLALTWPRAGFWIRMGALFIDIILVSVVWNLLGGHDTDRHSLPMLLLAGYGAVMWKLKGTTVGGLVCNLRVVRQDGREIDWSTAIVRALGCFLSLVVAGLGFFWIAFDSQHQAWHDKIAGTLVVRVPHGQHAAHA